MSDDSRSGSDAQDAAPLSREERLRLRDERKRRKAERQERREARQNRSGAPGQEPRQPKEGRPRKERHSARRVNRIAEFVGAKSYLEIGVAKGKTFLEVRIPHKVAVDPKFRFETAPHRTENVVFHETTSDAFFAQHPKSEKFDVIFIDGLHVFDQALRDFRNSLEVSHDRTVWLIDDVVPVDEYSAMTDAKKARELRWQTGNTSGAWHGDVYKVIYAIHDLHPEFSFVTVTSDGNPQAIVWRAARSGVAPAFGSVEAIDKVDYAQFVQSKALMNPRSEEEAFELFFASLKR